MAWMQPRPRGILPPAAISSFPIKPLPASPLATSQTDRGFFSRGVTPPRSILELRALFDARGDVAMRTACSAQRVLSSSAYTKRPTLPPPSIQSHRPTFAAAEGAFSPVVYASPARIRDSSTGRVARGAQHVIDEMAALLSA